MKPKTMVLMMVAVGCGLVASYMTSKLIADRGANQEPRIKVLVAKKKIKNLTMLNKPDELFIEKELPAEAVPKKAVKSFEELKDKRLNKTLTEESLVTTDDLINKDLAGLAANLPPGMRATALKVNPESLSGGFVLPGTRVDVVSTTSDGGEPISQIILQDMLVLAVDQQSNFEPTEKGTTMLGNTVTLAVTTDEALRLSLAGRLGDLRLLLRGLGDGEKTQTRVSKRSDLGRPIRGSSEMRTDDSLLAQGATPKIPELPPVPGDPPANPMQDMTEPQEDPLKTHRLTIISGDGQTTHTFIQDKDGTWKIGGSDRKNLEGDEMRPSKPKAAWPKVGVPAAEKKDEPKGADQEPRPLTLQEKLLQGSGLPLPGNSGK